MVGARLVASDYHKDRFNRGTMRIIVNAGIIASGFIPYAGPIIAPCLGIVEGIWSDELIYNHF